MFTGNGTLEISQQPTRENLKPSSEPNVTPQRDHTLPTGINQFSIIHYSYLPAGILSKKYIGILQHL